MSTKNAARIRFGLQMGTGWPLGSYMALRFAHDMWPPRFREVRLIHRAFLHAAERTSR